MNTKLGTIFLFEKELDDKCEVILHKSKKQQQSISLKKQAVASNNIFRQHCIAFDSTVASNRGDTN